MPLKEYQTLVGTAAGVVTIAQFFAPVFMIKNIIQQGNTKNVDPMPFIGGFGMSILMLQNGLMLNDAPMITVNIFAFVLNLLYTFIYYKYTKEKGELVGKFLRTMVFVLIMVAYGQIDMRVSPSRAEFIYGVIVTVVLLSLIGAPLLDVKTIIATKNADMLPFPLILSGTIVTGLWLLYGIITENVFMQFQNAVGNALTSVQFILCLKYSIFRKVPKKTKKDD